MINLPYQILLGSQSPRRKEILGMASIPFEVLDIDYEETYEGTNIPNDQIPVYLAEQKSIHARPLLDNELLITADTLVFYEDEIIGKPKSHEDAFNILKKLSGKKHVVISGVCIRYGSNKILFSDTTDVYFHPFDEPEIEYYINNYPVMDKAGAYAVQGWIGLVGIERIDGSYYNVMGLPIHKVYAHLKEISLK